MASEIKCPSCGHQFEPNEANREEVQNELRHKIKEWQEKKDEEFAVRLDQEKKQLRSAME
ncbi:MAG: DUF2130 domain-containing protein, partial [Chitinophagaceae bacterium]